MTQCGQNVSKWWVNQTTGTKENQGKNVCFKKIIGSSMDGIEIELKDHLRHLYLRVCGDTALEK